MNPELGRLKQIGRRILRNAPRVVLPLLGAVLIDSARTPLVNSADDLNTSRGDDLASATRTDILNQIALDTPVLNLRLGEICPNANPNPGEGINQFVDFGGGVGVFTGPDMSGRLGVVTYEPGDFINGFWPTGGRIIGTVTKNSAPGVLPGDIVAVDTNRDGTLDGFAEVRPYSSPLQRLICR